MSEKQLSTGSSTQFRAYELLTSTATQIATVIVTADNPAVDSLPGGFTTRNHEYIFYASGGEQAWASHTGDLIIKNAAQDDPSFLDSFQASGADIDCPNATFEDADFPGDWFYQNADALSYATSAGSQETRAIVVEFSSSAIVNLGWLRRNSSTTHALFGSSLSSVGDQHLLTKRTGTIGDQWNLKSMMLEA